MESGMRKSPAYIAFEERLKVRPSAYTFYAAMRGLEESNPYAPRFSESTSPVQDEIRVGQFPELSFPLSDIHSVWQHENSSVPVLNVQFQGLLGSQGALPLHITEYARERWVHDKDRTFVCFVNLFQHRWFTLFYRAWANAQPVVALHRKEPSTPVRLLSSVCGHTEDHLDSPRAQFAGFFQNQRRSSEGLAALAEGMLGIKPLVREFTGCWLPIPKIQRSCLSSKPQGGYNRLGLNTVLGKRVWDVQSKFDLAFSVADIERFERFNPLKSNFSPFRRAVNDYVNGQYDWGISITLSAAHAQSIRLGNKAQLGWNSWLGNAAKVGQKREVKLRITKGVNRFN